MYFNNKTSIIATLFVKINLFSEFRRNLLNIFVLVFYSSIKAYCRTWPWVAKVGREGKVRHQSAETKQIVKGVCRKINIRVIKNRVNYSHFVCLIRTARIYFQIFRTGV